MRTSVALLAALCLTFVTSSACAEGGWKMPSLNPFKKAGPPTSARVSDGSSSFKMPRLWPATGKTIVKKPSGPTTWQKFKSGTKSVWNKTADVLNPFDDANDNQEEPVQVTGSNSYFSQAANRREPEKKPSTFLPSWWSGGEEEEKPKTVGQFL